MFLLFNHFTKLCFKCGCLYDIAITDVRTDESKSYIVQAFSIKMKGYL